MDAKKRVSSRELTAEQYLQDVLGGDVGKVEAAHRPCRSSQEAQLSGMSVNKDISNKRQGGNILSACQVIDISQATQIKQCSQPYQQQRYPAQGRA